MANPLLGPADIGPVAAAIRLAARGFAVFPLLPGTKIPAVRRDWEGAASTDPVRIVDVWPDRRCHVAGPRGPPRPLGVHLHGGEGAGRGFPPWLASPRPAPARPCPAQAPPRAPP